MIFNKTELSLLFESLYKFQLDDDSNAAFRSELQLEYDDFEDLCLDFKSKLRRFQKGCDNRSNVENCCSCGFEITPFVSMTYDGLCRRCYMDLKDE